MVCSVLIYGNVKKLSLYNIRLEIKYIEKIKKIIKRSEVNELSFSKQYENNYESKATVFFYLHLIETYQYILFCYYVILNQLGPKSLYWFDKYLFPFNEIN